MANRHESTLFLLMQRSLTAVTMMVVVISALVALAATADAQAISDFPYLPDEVAEAADFTGTGFSHTAVNAPRTAPSGIGWATNAGGTYPANAAAILQSPSFDLTGQPDMELQFALWARTEAGRDGVKLQVSLDGGSSWQDVVGPSTPYNDSTTLSQALSLAFGGSDAAWGNNLFGTDPITITVSMEAWRNRSDVRFRWVFASDASVQRAGVVIDDFRVVPVASPLEEIGSYPVTLQPAQMRVNANAGQTLPATGDAWTYGTGTAPRPEQTGWFVVPDRNYLDDTRTWLQTPVLNLEYATPQDLWFDVWVRSEDLMDGLKVQASIDGGDTWIDLAPDTNAYNSSTAGSGVLVAGFGGSNTGWAGTALGGSEPLPTRVRLAAFAGESDVRIRWCFASDDSVRSSGVFINDIRIVPDLGDTPIVDYPWVPTDAETAQFHVNSTDDVAWAGSVFEFGMPEAPRVSEGAAWALPLAGSYRPDTRAALYLPPLDLTNAQPQQLTFRLWMLSEALADGMKLQASIDGGASWTDVQPETNGYNSATSVSQVLSTFFGGSDDGWMSPGLHGGSARVVRTSLKVFNGQVLRLRFVFASDASSSQSGVVIDGISVAPLDGITTINQFPYEPDDVTLGVHFHANQGDGPFTGDEFVLDGVPSSTRGEGDAWQIGDPASNYARNTATALYSPIFDLSGEGPMELRFDLWVRAWEGVDGLKLQGRDPAQFGPPAWQDLDATTNATNSDTATSGLLATLFGGGNSAWSNIDRGESAPREVRVDLSGFSNAVQLRWVFVSDGGTSRPGVAIDRVRVMARETLPVVDNYPLQIAGGEMAALVRTNAAADTAWEGSAAQIGTPATPGFATGTVCASIEPDHTYVNNTIASIDFPALDLSSAPVDQLRFDMWLRADIGFDGAKLQVSTDGGTTWADVTTASPAYNGGTTTSNRFADTVGGSNDGWGSVTGPFDGTDWTNVTLALAPWLGQSDVRFRVVFGSDATQRRWGLRIANIMVTVPTDLQPVTDLVATADVDAVTWSWTDNSWNEDGYRIYDADSPGDVLAEIAGNSTEWKTPPLLPNTRSFVDVRAFSGPAEATGVVTSPTSTLIPTPTLADLSLVQTAPDELTFTVTPPNNPMAGATGYEVERDSGAGFVVIRPYMTDQTYTVIDGGLTDTTHRYRVRLFNQDGEPTAWSEPIEYTGGDLLISAMQTGGTITWSWSNILGSTHTGWEVVDANGNVLASLPLAQLDYTEDVTENTTVARRVRAVDGGGGEVAFSDATFTALIFVGAQPGAGQLPEGVAVDRVGESGEFAIWMRRPFASTFGATGVELVRDRNTAAETTLVAADQQIYDAWDKSATGTLENQYSLRYRNRAGDWTDWRDFGVTAATLTAAATDFDGVSNNPGEILWSWSTVAGATGYRVEDSHGNELAELADTDTSWLEPALVGNDEVTRQIVVLHGAYETDAVAAMAVVRMPAPDSSALSLARPSGTTVVARAEVPEDGRIIIEQADAEAGPFTLIHDSGATEVVAIPVLENDAPWFRLTHVDRLGRLSAPGPAQLSPGGVAPGIRVRVLPDEQTNSPSGRILAVDGEDATVAVQLVDSLGADQTLDGIPVTFTLTPVESDPSDVLVGPVDVNEGLPAVEWTALTGPDGIATVRLESGSDAGFQFLTIIRGDVDNSPATVTVSQYDDSVSIAASQTADWRIGDAVLDELQITISGLLGRPVDETVEIRSLTPTIADFGGSRTVQLITGDDGVGVAQVTLLGPGVAAFSIRLQRPDLQYPTISFATQVFPDSASGTPGEPATIVLDADDRWAIYAGDEIRCMTGRVLDADGNGVPNQPVFVANVPIGSDEFFVGHGDQDSSTPTTTLQWYSGAVSPMAGPGPGPRVYATATALLDGRVMVAGGAVSDATDLAPGAWFWSFDTCEWTAAPAGFIDRWGHTARLLADGRVEFLGGFDATGAIVQTQVFNPATGSWSNRGQTLATGRGLHSLLVNELDGSVVVAGGIDGDGAVLGTVELLTPDGVSRQVLTLPMSDDYPAGRTAVRPALVQYRRDGHAADGRILLIGDLRALEQDLRVYELDFANDTVNILPDLVPAGLSLTQSVAAAHTLPFDGLIAVAGPIGVTIFDPYDNTVAPIQSTESLEDEVNNFFAFQPTFYDVRPATPGLLQRDVVVSGSTNSVRPMLITADVDGNPLLVAQRPEAIFTDEIGEASTPLTGISAVKARAQAFIYGGTVGGDHVTWGTPSRRAATMLSTPTPQVTSRGGVGGGLDRLTLVTDENGRFKIDRIVASDQAGFQILRIVAPPFGGFGPAALHDMVIFSRDHCDALAWPTDGVYGPPGGQPTDPGNTYELEPPDPIVPGPGAIPLPGARPIVNNGPHPGNRQGNGGVSLLTRAVCVCENPQSIEFEIQQSQRVTTIKLCQPVALDADCEPIDGVTVSITGWEWKRRNHPFSSVPDPSISIVDGNLCIEPTPGPLNPSIPPGSIQLQLGYAPSGPSSEVDPSTISGVKFKVVRDPQDVGEAEQECAISWMKVDVTLGARGFCTEFIPAQLTGPKVKEPVRILMFDREDQETLWTNRVSLEQYARESRVSGCIHVNSVAAMPAPIKCEGDESLCRVANKGDSCVLVLTCTDGLVFGGPDITRCGKRCITLEIGKLHKVPVIPVAPGISYNEAPEYVQAYIINQSTLSALVASGASIPGEEYCPAKMICDEIEIGVMPTDIWIGDETTATDDVVVRGEGEESEGPGLTFPDGDVHNSVCARVYGFNGLVMARFAVEHFADGPVGGFAGLTQVQTGTAFRVEASQSVRGAANGKDADPYLLIGDFPSRELDDVFVRMWCVCDDPACQCHPLSRVPGVFTGRPCIRANYSWIPFTVYQLTLEICDPQTASDNYTFGNLNPSASQAELRVGLWGPQGRTVDLRIGETPVTGQLSFSNDPMTLDVDHTALTLFALPPALPTSMKLACGEGKLASVVHEDPMDQNSPTKQELVDRENLGIWVGVPIYGFRVSDSLRDVPIRGWLDLGRPHEAFGCNAADQFLGSLYPVADADGVVLEGTMPRWLGPTSLQASVLSVELRARNTDVEWDDVELVRERLKFDWEVGPDALPGMSMQLQPALGSMPFQLDPPGVEITSQTGTFHAIGDVTSATVGDYVVAVTRECPVVQIGGPDLIVESTAVIEDWSLVEVSATGDDICAWKSAVERDLLVGTNVETASHRPMRVTVTRPAGLVFEVPLPSRIEGDPVIDFDAPDPMPLVGIEVIHWYTADDGSEAELRYRPSVSLIGPDEERLGLQHTDDEVESTEATFFAAKLMLSADGITSFSTALGGLARFKGGDHSSLVIDLESVPSSREWELRLHAPGSPTYASLATNQALLTDLGVSPLMIGAVGQSVGTDPQQLKAFYDAGGIDVVDDFRLVFGFEALDFDEANGNYPAGTWSFTDSGSIGWEITGMGKGYMGPPFFVMLEINYTDDAEHDCRQLLLMMIEPDPACIKQDKKKQPCGDERNAGDPVEIETGEVVHQVTDLFIPGRGLHYSHSRTYRSKAAIKPVPLSVHGARWSHDLEQFIEIDQSAGGEERLFWQMGHSQRSGRYLAPDTLTLGQYRPPSQVFAELRADGNTFVQVQPGGEIWTYERMGTIARRISRADRFGNTITYAYDSQTGQMTQVTDTLGRVITYAYYADGRLQTITDFTGRQIEYEYDVDGNLSAVNYPEVTSAVNGVTFAGSDRRRMTYAYHPANADEQSRALLQSITNPNENSSSYNTPGVPALTPKVTFEYGDSEYRVTRQTLGFGAEQRVYQWDYEDIEDGQAGFPDPTAAAANNHDVIHTVVTATDPAGNVTEYGISGQRQITLKTELTDQGPRITRWLHDSESRVIRTESTYGSVVTYEYEDSLITLQSGGQDFEFHAKRRGLNVIRETVLPGVRGGDQGSLTTGHIYDPFYNLTCVTVAPRGFAAGYVQPDPTGGAGIPTSVARYATRFYLDYEENPAGNMPAIAAQLFAGDPNGLLKTQGLMAHVMAQFDDIGIGSALDNVPGASLAVGTDINGDGVTNGHAGNVVRVLFPAATLHGRQEALANESGGTQYTTIAYYFNQYGQRTAYLDAEGNLRILVYNGADDYDGDGQVEVAGADTLTGGYMARNIYDADPVGDVGLIVVPSGPAASIAWPIPRRRATAPTAEVTEIVYDDLGRVVEHTDPRLATTTFIYNALNQMIQSAAPAPYNYVRQRRHDANGQVTAVLVPNVDPDLTSNMVTFTGEDYLVASAGQPFVHASAYSILEQLKSRTLDQGGLDLTTAFEYAVGPGTGSVGSLTAVTSAEGIRTETEYDSRALPFRTTTGAGTLAAGVGVITYDEGTLVQTVADATGGFTTYEYDGYARVVAVTNQVGTRTEYEYDPDSNIVHIQTFGDSDDGAGHFVLLRDVRLFYDEQGRHSGTHEEIFSVDPLTGARTDYNEALDLTHIRKTLRARDRNGEIIATIDDRTNEYLSVYDGRGRKIRSEDPLGNTVEYEYEPGSLLTRVVVTQIHTLGGADEVSVTDYDYDTIGRLTRVTDNVGNVTRFAYDARGNRVYTILPDGTRIINTYDAVSRVVQMRTLLTQTVARLGGGSDNDITETFTYDGDFRVLTREDDNGNTHTFTYDERGRLETHTDPNGKVQSYIWDADSRLIGYTDPDGNFRAYTYDDAHRLKLQTVIRNSSILATGGSQRALSRSMEAIGTTEREFFYDGLNRQTRVRQNNRGDQAAATTPDATNFNVWCTMEWDSLSQLRGEQVQVLGQTFESLYTYNSINHLQQHQYPGGQVLTFETDALGRLRRMFGSAGGGDPGTNLVIECDYVGGTEIRRHFGLNDIDLDLSDYDQHFDAVNRPIKRQYTRSDDSQVMGWEYGYDERSRVLAENRTHELHAARTFAYDDASRLQQWAQGSLPGGLNSAQQSNPGSATPEPTGQDFMPGDLTLTTVTRQEDFTSIDGLGNRLDISRTEGSENETREFSPANELLVRTINATPESLLYQPNGHRAEDGDHLYYYTADGQLREVWRKTGGASQLAAGWLYDGLGRRTVRLSDDDGNGSLETAVILVCAGQRVIEEYDAPQVTFTPEDLGNAGSSRDTASPATAGTAITLLQQREYLYSTGIDDRCVFRRDSNGDGTLDESYTYLTDQIGTVFGLADASAVVVEAYDYDAYGAPYRVDAGLDGMLFTTDDLRLGASPGISLLGNPYLFQGRRWDPSVGLFDFRMRHYDPDRYLWLTRDPAGFVNGSNLYQFVGSMPWVTDPMGLCGRERSWGEFLRDAGAGFLDGAIEGLTFGLAEDVTIFGDMMGADTNSMAYMGGKIVGNIAGGMVAGMATGGAATCGQVSRLARAGAKALKWAERAAAVKDGVNTVKDLAKAFRCGDPMAIAMAVAGGAMQAAPFLGSAIGKKIDVSPCGRNCFVAGTPVWVLKEGCDPGEANAALAAAESEAASTGDRSILAREIEKWATTRPIEMVITSDHALSRDQDHANGPLVFQPIAQTFRNTASRIVILEVAADETGTPFHISTTLGHPFWVDYMPGPGVPPADVASTAEDWDAGGLTVVTRGWVCAKHVKCGCVLITPDGRRVVVISKTVARVQETTFNLEVASTHSYFVGSIAVWVHNTSRISCPTGVLPFQPRAGSHMEAFDDELVRQTRALREQQDLLNPSDLSNRNVASARVEIDGQTEYITHANQPRGPHSEEFIAAEVNALREQGHTVEVQQLYSERIPCTEAGGCRQMIGQHMQGADVWHTTARHGEDAAEDLQRLYGISPD